MAKSLVLVEKEDTVNIVVDGNEIHGVLGYELRNNFDGSILEPAELTLRIAINKTVDVRLK